MRVAKLFGLFVLPFFMYGLLVAPLHGQPSDDNGGHTPPRDWTATTGQTIHAIALRYDGTTVTLLTPARREISVPASRLVEDDITYLEDFFPSPKALHTPGQPSSPIRANHDSSYISYIPSTYNRRGKHPLLVHVNRSGVSEENMVRFQPALEKNKWCYIGLVESNNQQTPEKNLLHARASIKHAIANMPVDPKRIYFAANSAACAQALYNLNKLRGAGAWLGDPHFPKRFKVPPTINKDLVVAGKVTGPQRYASAEIARKNGGRRTTNLYYHDHGFYLGPEWAVVDALQWLDARHFIRSYTATPAERQAFERAVLERIQEYQQFMDYRTYHWAKFMTTQWKISEANKEAYQTLLTGLGNKPETIQFSAALDEMADFALRHWARFGKEYAPVHNHNDKTAAVAARKLAETYSQSQMLEETLPMLAEKTDPRPEKEKANAKADE